MLLVVYVYVEDVFSGRRNKYEDSNSEEKKL